MSGLRTFQGLAWLAREGLPGPDQGHSPVPEQWLARPIVARGLGFLAAGELAGDKIPGVPDRVAFPGIVGRVLAGAVAGAVAARPGSKALGAAVGAASATAGAYAGWFLRRELGRARLVPDFALAVMEDAVAVGLARRLARIRG